ncbi:MULTISPECIES: hypothetical protein [Pseudoalteromonas]|uniref:Uncharacterized protein n=1 Tax=Pseudoalteromonas luteoviolacea (strain 2ta16) TaxID=1353533 RepID=V4HWM8_PSEL2|nr:MULTISPECIES: hypothetical protein [Pseudoalteromonas]ESP95245.1 hypothetical protein PL2TA16_03759 [Pseudoalteromonas luteoviolacea 2ta16]KZN37841.1 hypothetical protein N483_21125 [Pseudoalteromonas luteoviolacea NCIMB 1944]MCG7551488.1 hypothetical protein [Pseudoalteromonas sp. Of7M-16]
MRVFQLLFAVSLATLLCVTAAGVHAAEERQQVIELIADLDLQYLDVDLDEALPLASVKSSLCTTDFVNSTSWSFLSSSQNATQIRAPPAQ